MPPFGNCAYLHVTDESSTANTDAPMAMCHEPNTCALTDSDPKLRSGTCRTAQAQPIRLDMIIARDLGLRTETRQSPSQLISAIRLRSARDLGLSKIIHRLKLLKHRRHCLAQSGQNSETLERTNQLWLYLMDQSRIQAQRIERTRTLTKYRYDAKLADNSYSTVRL